MKISDATLNRLHQNMIGAYESFISPVEAQTLVAMIEATERAWWWREVTDPDEVIPAGCPARAEWPGYAYEAYESTKTADRPARFLTYPLTGIRVFIDTRWAPPAKPLKVGDVIETVEDLERLPVGAGVVDGGGDLAQKTVSGGFQFADHNPVSHPPESIIHCEPFTLVYLPKAGGSDD